MNHFFNTTTTATVNLLTNVPSYTELSLLYTAIYHDEEILSFVGAPDELVTDDFKLSQIGVIRGIMEFSGQFDLSSQVDSIDTQKRRYIISSLYEERQRIFVVMCVNLGYTKSWIDNKETIEYDQSSISNNDYLMNVLIRGMKNFQLCHGGILANRHIVDKWWGDYVKIAFKDGFKLKDQGICLSLQKLKKSSAKLPIGLKQNLDLKIEEIMTDQDCLNISIMNADQHNFANYGSVYISQSEFFSHLQVCELIQFIQFIDLKTGQFSEALVESDNLVLPKLQDTVNDAVTTFLQDPLTPIVYDPINATIGVMSNYIPNLNFWSTSTLPIETLNEIDTVSCHIINKNPKKVYLDGTKFRVVFYQIKELVISLVFRDDGKDIRYEKIAESLNEIYKIYLCDIKFEDSAQEFEYIIENEDCYYSSLSLVGEDDSILKRHISIANLWDSISIDINNESIIKSSKDCWFLYQLVEGRKITILRKSDENDQINDFKKMFTSSSGEDLKNEFVSNLGSDVLNFWKMIFESEDNFR